jgi:hypothetical protein
MFCSWVFALRRCGQGCNIPVAHSSSTSGENLVRKLSNHACVFHRQSVIVHNNKPDFSHESRYLLPESKQTNSVVWVRQQAITTSDCRLSAKLVPTFVDRGCYVVSAANPYGRNLGFLDRSRCGFFQVAPQLYSRGWVHPIPDQLLLRKSGSARNRTQISGSY